MYPNFDGEQKFLDKTMDLVSPSSSKRISYVARGSNRICNKCAASQKQRCAALEPTPQWLWSLLAFLCKNFPYWIYRRIFENLVDILFSMASCSVKRNPLSINAGELTLRSARTEQSTTMHSNQYTIFVLFIFCPSQFTFASYVSRKRSQPIPRTERPMFRLYFDRGDLPVSQALSRRRSKDTILEWRVGPADLNYSHYLPIFFDGYAIWNEQSSPLYLLGYLVAVSSVDTRRCENIQHVFMY